MGGNKWRKLKYNLVSAKKNELSTLLTFGGAYSNHIYAVAAAGKLLGFKTIGLIRGEEPSVPSATLLYAKSQGMQLEYVSRTDYRKKSDVDFITRLKQQFGQFYLIPEGGSNTLAIRGVKEMMLELNQQVSGKKIICCASGTGGTLAGLIEGVANSHDYVLGFPVLKNASWMTDEIESLLVNKQHRNWSLSLDYHFGGYAKVNQALIDFIYQFKSDYHIQLEPVYTGKLMYGLFDLIANDYFDQGSTIVAIHTGGLQGLKGFKEFNEKLQ